MDFIKACTDYYGTPKGNLIYINPNYIIKLEFMLECKDSYGNVFSDHYVATIDLGNNVETVHITLESGKKLIKEGEIKIEWKNNI